MDKDNIFLHYIISNASITLIKKIPENIFISEINRLYFNLFKEFCKTYKTKPSLLTFTEYLKGRKEVPEQLHQSILEIHDKNIDSFEESTEFYGNLLIKEITTRVIKSKMIEISAAMLTDNGNEKAEQIANAMLTEIKSIEEDEEVDRYNLKDADFTDISSLQVLPSPYKQLNSLTEDGGFASPQHIIIAGQYKTNKTTFLINVGVGYAIMGHNVLFVDTENGKRNIKKRILQRLTETPLADIKKGVVTSSGLNPHEMYNKVVENIDRLGGNIHFISVPADVYDLSQVEYELNLVNQNSPKPVSVIIYDYLDQYKAMDKRLLNEQRIQAVTKHAIRLNKKYNTFSFSPSHINREGIKGKKVGEKVGGEHLAGALAKMNDAHAVFLLEYESFEAYKSYGLSNPDTLILSVLAQREGVRKGEVFFSLDIAIQKIEEIDIDEEEVDDR